MKFFIDTANLAQIKEANDLGILDGVTTNPSLMAKEGIKGKDAVMAHYKTICEMVDGDISAEVISTDFDGIVAEGKVLAAIHPNIVVKVPMIKDGTSNTIALMETRSGLGPWARGGASSVRGFALSDLPAIGDHRPFGGHTRGVNVAMADGSVRFIRDTIDPKILAAAITIAGGESVDWD